MTFRPRVWYPIAVALSAINLGAVWFAARPGEPWHAMTHAGLALAFGLWAQRLGRDRRGTGIGAELEPLEIEMSRMRQELLEAQERLDFAERVLTRERDPGRVKREEPGGTDPA